MKIKLLPKFILSLGVIGVILTIAISLFSYRSSRSYLENLYAQRVMTNSNSIADMMSVSDVKKILAEGGDKTEEYSEMVTLFDKLKKDGDVTYLSLVVPDEDSVTFYIDTCVESMGDLPENQMPWLRNWEMILRIRSPMEVTFCILTLQILMILLTWRNILPYGTSISRIKVWIIRL